jgi:hypothetical protein
MASDEFGNQPQIWLVFSLNVFFGLVFGASAYGLWRRQSWGRILFLWALVFWSAFDLISLFIGNDDTIPAIIVNVLRVAIGLVISLWYFNLPRVTALFYRET